MIIFLVQIKYINVKYVMMIIIHYLNVQNIIIFLYDKLLYLIILKNKQYKKIKEQKLGIYKESIKIINH